MSTGRMGTGRRSIGHRRPAAPTVIVGAGPHSLTIAVRLLHEGAVDPDDLVVVDPAGDWMATWRAQFAALHIDHLRSPVVHHPHPDPYALLDLARSQRRVADLHGRYQCPGTDLFAAFCATVIRQFGVEGAVTAGRVTRIDPDGCVTWTTTGGSTERCGASRIVVATNPRSATEPFPAGVASGDVPAVVHAGEVDTAVVRPGEHVAIIGGGLTAAHLACCAAERGARVTLLSRRQLVEREFDTDPGWLGPREMGRFLGTACLATRARMAVDARGGGSIPAWMIRRLVELQRTGLVAHEVVEARADTDGRDGDDDHDLGTDMVGRIAGLGADHVWGATGWRVSTSCDPVLGPLVDATGCATVDELLVLGPRLELPNTSVPVHVVGRPASLRLGPTAGNLAGARRAADLLVGDDPDAVH